MFSLMGDAFHGQWKKSTSSSLVACALKAYIPDKSYESVRVALKRHGIAPRKGRQRIR